MNQSISKAVFPSGSAATASLLRASRRALSRLLPVLLWILLILPSLSAAYLSEDFSVDLTNLPNAPNGQGAWTNNFWYGRAGITVPLPNAASAVAFSNAVSKQIFSNGKLVFLGEPNPADGTSSRDGRWKGKFVWNTNRFGASTYQPFGWEVVRERSFIEPSYASAGNWVPGLALDARKHAMIGMAMFVDSTALPVNKAYGTNRNSEYEAFERYFDFVDHCGCWATTNNDMRQIISFYDGTENSLNGAILAATGPSGNATNISSLLNWDYNLNVNQASATNTNAIGFRMVHTGSAIALYVNPNPYDLRPDMPNEWLYLDERGVTWTNNFQIMIGTQCYGFSGYLGLEYAAGNFDNLLVRNAATATGFWVEPLRDPEGAEGHRFAVHLSNQLAPFPQDAGVNQLALRAPGGFAFEARLAASTAVRVDREDGIPLELIPHDPSHFPGPHQAAYRIGEGGARLVLILGKTLEGPGVRWLHVGLALKALPGLHDDAEPFAAWVNAEQYAAMPAPLKNRYSTAGGERSRNLGPWRTPPAAAGR